MPKYPVITMIFAATLLWAPAAFAQNEYVQIQPNPSGVGTKMSFSATKLEVNDLELALKFYRDTLGMKESARMTSPTLREIMLKFDGDSEPTLVLVKHPEERKVEVGNAYGYLVITTPDINGLIARIRSNGFTVSGTPREAREFGLAGLIFLKDPEGRPIEIVELVKK